MDFIAFRNQERAKAQAIRNELEKEVADLEKQLQNSIQKAKNIKKALAHAENVAVRAENAAVRANKPVRSPKPNKTRSRRPGANYEIAGRPAQLTPGAPLRTVEGTRSHSRNLAATRGRRNKARY